MERLERAEPVEGVATSDIAVGDGHSLRVVWQERECFASMTGHCNSFGMSAGASVQERYYNGEDGRPEARVGPQRQNQVS